jgi:hypothetical protein
MVFGKMENPMDLDYIMLKMLSIWDSSKTELNMAKESSILALVYIKAILLLEKNKGKDFFLIKKNNVMKVTSRKASNMVMENGYHSIVFSNTKVFSRMEKNKGLESFKNKINTITKECSQMTSQMQLDNTLKSMM